MAGPDRGKHSDMVQSNAQRRDNALNRDDAERHHDNDMGIKKRIAPTPLHSHQLLNETFEALSFDNVNNESGDTRDEIFAMIIITLEDRPHIPATLKVKVDTGASENILPLRIFRRMYPTKLNAEGFPAQRTLVPSNAVRTAYNGTKIQQYGTMTIPCFCRGKRCYAEFYVSSSTGPAILELESAENSVS